MSLRALSSLLLVAAFSLAESGNRLLAMSAWFQNPTIQNGNLANRSGSGSKTPASGTADFVFQGNRMFAELGFIRPDGTLHKAYAFVDLGSPSAVVSPSLFKELGLDQKKPLSFHVGEMTVTVDSSTVENSSWLPTFLGEDRKVEAVLPAGIMQKFQVVMDYAQHSMTLAQPGTLKPQGTPIPIRVNDKTGLAVVEATIDGKPYAITIDNGSAYTWLQKTAVQPWLDAHPDWQRGIGAVGNSNMRMDDDGIEATGTLIRIPEIKLGLLTFSQVGALAIGPSKAQGDFIGWYSRKNPVPVIGWLGGNVLQGFRITIDYPNHMSYWVSQSPLDPHDLDQIGLTLISRHGSYFVAAIATQNGKPTVDGVQAGDRLLQVDGLQITGATRGAILSAMHGKPGEIRTLTLERDGKTFTTPASVREF
jgi:hypothetical protein